MEYVYILPMVEVLVFNVITLDHCFKRKYSKFKMVAVFFFFTIITESKKSSNFNASTKSFLKFYILISLQFLLL